MQALRGAHHVAGGVKQVEHCMVGGEAGRVARGDVLWSSRQQTCLPRYCKAQLWQLIL